MQNQIFIMNILRSLKIKWICKWMRRANMHFLEREILFQKLMQNRWTSVSYQNVRPYLRLYLSSFQPIHIVHPHCSKIVPTRKYTCTYYIIQICMNYMKILSDEILGAYRSEFKLFMFIIRYQFYLNVRCINISKLRYFYYKNALIKIQSRSPKWKATCVHMNI